MIHQQLRDGHAPLSVRRALIRGPKEVALQLQSPFVKK